jgi:glycosyltransferase involved in cell wall biosynthesis
MMDCAEVAMIGPGQEKRATSPGHLDRCGPGACPDVSLIVTYFNEGDLLHRALQSIEQLRYPGNIEALVVDDSSEVPPTIPAGLSLPVRIVRSERNLYAGGARNLGLANTSGELVGFLDADDVYLPNKLEVQVGFLTVHPEVGLVGGPYFVHESEEIRLEIPHVIRECYPEYASRECILPASFRFDLCVFYGFNTGQMLFRRSVLAAVEGFDESHRWGEEWDLLVKIAQRAPIGYLPVPTYRYLCRDRGSITSTKNPEKYATASRMFREWRNEICGLPPSHRNAIRKREQEWHLLAAQLYLEHRNDALSALKESLNSLRCRPSIWGIRSSVRSGLRLAAAISHRRGNHIRKGTS